MATGVVTKTPAARKRQVTWGSVNCVVRCFPSSGRGTLSLEHYYDQESVKNHADRTQRIKERLSSINVKKAYAPTVAPMNATLINFGDLSEEIQLSNDVSLLRDRTMPGEGGAIPVNETIAASVGGCRCLIAIGDSYCLFVHVGADSLVDRKRIECQLAGIPYDDPRKHESVIFAITDFFSRRGVALANVLIQCLFGLEAYTHDLRHAKHGGYNQALLEDVFEKWQPYSDKKLINVDGIIANFNLFLILKAQAISAGIRPSHVRDDLLMPINGYFGNTRHPNPILQGETNLVTATRIS